LLFASFWSMTTRVPQMLAHHGRPFREDCPTHTGGRALTSQSDSLAHKIGIRTLLSPRHSRLVWWGAARLVFGRCLLFRLESVVVSRWRCAWTEPWNADPWNGRRGGVGRIPLPIVPPILDWHSNISALSDQFAHLGNQCAVTWDEQARLSLGFVRGIPNRRGFNPFAHTPPSALPNIPQRFISRAVSAPCPVAFPCG
jgi:hypothetical protein